MTETSAGYDYRREDDDTVEIDLVKLCYRMLIRWRRAIIVGLVLAVALGGFQLVSQLIEAGDSEEYERALNSYVVEYNKWKSEESVYNSNISKLKAEQSRQLEYNENSVLMKINPQKEWIGNITFYIDSEYKIDPNLTYQEKDKITQILAAYSSYINGELYKEIISETDISDLSYLKEILSATVDSNLSTIRFEVLSADQSSVENLLEIIRNKITERSEYIVKNVSSHTINEISSSVDFIIDTELEATQKANLAVIDELNVSIGEAQKELDDYLEKSKSKSEPEFEYSVKAIAKKSINWAVISGVVGIFVVFVWYAVKYVLSDRFEAEKLRYCGNTYEIGRITIIDTCAKKLPFAGVDRWLMRKFRIGGVSADFAGSCALAGANIAKIISKLGADAGIPVAAVGAIDKALAKEIEAKVGNIKYIGDILSDSDAANALEAYNIVCVIADENTNRTSEISRQNENLRVWGKYNLGTVIIGECGMKVK